MRALLALLLACSSPPPDARAPGTPAPEASSPAPPAQASPLVPADLTGHCAAVAPEPAVEQVAPGVWVARGYDLANTILIATSAGNVVVDPGMSPARAAPARAALRAVAPGPTLAIVYTHSHIDHVGGASAWLEEGTQVWATEAFTRTFFAQYGRFLPAEAARGARQYGQDVGLEDLPCASLGRRPDLAAAMTNGTVLPTHTLEERRRLTFGGVVLDLVAAPGETQDALFVHLPEAGLLLPGDNWVGAFPDLYVLRGTRPRPVEAWIHSLDEMRRLDPQVLVPSHTAPVQGREEVRAALTAYRDGIQWVRDAVVRGANRGTPLAPLAAATALPPHLAALPALQETHGRVDWSVRALYQGELGWFDGGVEALYPLPPDEQARRTLALMGGAERVLAEARRVRAAGDPAWALQLLRTCEQAGVPGLDGEVAGTLSELAGGTANPDGRAWLLQAAEERRHGRTDLGLPTLSDDFIDGIPTALLFEVMATRLRPEMALEVHEAVRFVLDDVGETWLVTVRRGVAEVVAGEPLPGTPEPIAVVTTTAATWRRVALGQEEPVAAVAARRIQVDGDPMALHRFLERFDRSLL